MGSASWYCSDAEMRLSCRVLVIAVMLRRGFQSSCLGAMLVARISLAFGVCTLLFDDLSSVIFRQPTMSLECYSTALVILIYCISSFSRFSSPSTSFSTLKCNELSTHFIRQNIFPQNYEIKQNTKIPIQ